MFIFYSLKPSVWTVFQCSKPVFCNLCSDCLSNCFLCFFIHAIIPVLIIISSVSTHLPVCVSFLILSLSAQFTPLASSTPPFSPDLIIFLKTTSTDVPTYVKPIYRPIQLLFLEILLIFFQNSAILCFFSRYFTISLTFLNFFISISVITSALETSPGIALTFCIYCWRSFLINTKFISYLLPVWL